MLFWRKFWQQMNWVTGLSLGVLGVLGLSALLAPWIAPYDYRTQFRKFHNAPPTRLHLAPVSEWDRGIVYFHPVRLVDPRHRRYAEIPERKHYLRFFTRGKLFATDDPEVPVFLLGTDSLGRDLFTRILYGGRISLSIGPVGVAISFTLGILIGTVSGYFGGRVDNLIMRLTEILMSLPSFYFLLILAVIIPTNLPSAQTFLLIVAIMSFIGWAGLARIIRGLVMSEREREYVLAARALGASTARVLLRHVIPSTFNYAVVAATLSIPGYILGESALSLLGLGIKEPDPSWGNLLAEAQNIQNLIHFPWVLIPGVFIFVTIMAFNFLGDALRDTLDPRAQKMLR